jgi:hypothetical protein
MSVSSLNEKVKKQEPEALAPIPLKKIYDNSKPTPPVKPTYEESDQMVVNSNFLFGSVQKPKK